MKQAVKLAKATLFLLLFLAIFGLFLAYFTDYALLSFLTLAASMAAYYVLLSLRAIFAKTSKPIILEFMAVSRNWPILALAVIISFAVSLIAYRPAELPRFASSFALLLATLGVALYFSEGDDA